MFTQFDRRAARMRRHRRVRGRGVVGTAERPRLAVFRSLHHVSAQLIDDVNGHTLFAASTHESAIASKLGKSTASLAAAIEVGKAIGARAKEGGVTRIVFDRGGYLYHGRIKALADAAREAGLEF